jgi:hypothetical protein
MRALRLNALGAPTYIRDLPLASSKRVAAPDTGGHFRGVTAAAALTLSGHSVLPVRARAVSDHMEPFDRDDFASWPGAFRRSMRGIGRETQHRHGAKEPGLRWAKSAPRLCCDARPMHRIALRAAPCRMNRFGSIESIPYGRKPL